MNGRAAGALVLLLWIAAAVPPLAAIADVGSYGVDVPAGDQWSLAPMFERLDPGSVAPNGLFGQANESRPAVPRLFFLALSRLGHWNVKREMFATQGLLILTSLGLALLSRRLGLGWRETSVALVFANMALFSTAQYSNFLWGIQFIVYLPFACLVWLAWAVSGPLSDPKAFLVAALLCVVATFSYANGMLVWPLAAALLLTTRGVGRRNTISWLGWASAGAVSVTFYFHGYQHPGGHPGFSAALRAPSDAALAFFAFLGSNLTVDGRFVVRPFPLAVLSGLGMCTVLGMIAALAVWQRRQASFFRAVSIWFCLAAYGLGSAGVTVAGRLGFGREYVLTSRYIAFSATTIVAIAFLAAIAWKFQRDQGHAHRASWVSHAAVALATAFTVLWALNSWECRAHQNEWRRTRLQARALLPFADIAEADDVKVVLTPPVPADLPALWKRLVDLGVLEDVRPRFEEGGAADMDKSMYGHLERLDRVGDGECEAAGWTYIPASRRAGDAVLVTVRTPEGRRALAAAVPRTPRNDIVVHMSAPRAIISGWRVRFAAPAPGQELEFWTLDGATARAYALARTPGVP